jgi:DNA-binding HxlR family transcriptional regulator
MQVFEALNYGAGNFEKIQKITGLERDELVSILDDLEKRGMMKVGEKSGLFGPKVELYLTDKGIKEYNS